jgi:hypothetical protein
VRVGLKDIPPHPPTHRVHLAMSGIQTHNVVFSFYYDVAVGFIDGRNLSSGRKTTDLMQVIDKLSVF